MILCLNSIVSVCSPLCWRPRRCTESTICTAGGELHQALSPSPSSVGGGIPTPPLYLNNGSAMEIEVIYFMLQFDNRCHIKLKASKSFNFENTHYQRKHREREREGVGILFLRLEYILLNDIHNEFIICIWATSSLL